MNTPGALAYRSHHGDRQHWHSMASGTEKSNQEVVDKIVAQAHEWWDQASKEIMRLYDSKANFSKFEKFLREGMYGFAPGAAEKPPIGTLERYRKAPPDEILPP